MTLNYDIDILPEPGPHSAEQVGLDAPAQIYFAAFRSPDTAQALKSASTRTRAILSEAGIAPDPYSTGTPEGLFPYKDADARAHVMSCVVSALSEDARAEAEPDPSGFDISEFLVHLSAAQPYGALVPVPPPADTASKAAKGEGLAVYVALGVLSCSGFFAGATLF